jgi:hypothetical protein
LVSNIPAPRRAAFRPKLKVLKTEKNPVKPADYRDDSVHSLHLRHDKEVSEMLREIVSSAFGELLSRNNFAALQNDNSTSDGRPLRFTSRAFDIRFSNDRGDIYIDIFPPHAGEEFYLAENVLELVGYLDDGMFVGNGIIPLTAMANALDQHFLKLEKLFSEKEWDVTKEKLAEIRRQRVKRQFPALKTITKH